MSSITVTRQPQRPFHLLLCSLFFGLSLNLMGADVDFIYVVKEQHYIQTAEHIVGLREDAPFYFGIGAMTSDLNLLTSVTVTPPSGDSISLSKNVNEGKVEYVKKYKTLPSMNEGSPSVSYAFQFFTKNDGPKNVTLDLKTGDKDYMSLTTFTGFDDCKRIDAASEKTFEWNAITDGKLDDIVSFEIRDESGTTVFKSPDPDVAGALTGLSTSVTVPANTLTKGSNYKARLYLVRPVDTNENYAPGVIALAAYAKAIKMEIRTSGNSNDHTPPQLEKTYPWEHDDAAETNSIVTFVFNEAMDQSVNVSEAITWTGVDSSKFDYSWSSDGRRLFCKYRESLPVSTTIEWWLQSYGSTTKFKDASGNELAGGRSGGFTTKSTSNYGGPDIKRINFHKVRLYEQTADAAVASPSLIGHETFIEVNFNGVSTISSVELLTPGSDVPSTNFGGFKSEWFQGGGNFAEEGDMDRAFPDGEYSLLMKSAHSGDITVKLKANSANYPNIPTVTNFAETQNWDSTKPLTLRWNKMEGGTSSDTILIYIEGERDIFETPELGAGSLDGTATKVTVPANTLPPGRALNMGVIFVKGKTKETPQASVSAIFTGEAAVTHIKVHTAGDPIKPTIKIEAGGGTTPQITIRGEIARKYELSSSSDLKNWKVERVHYLWIRDEGFFGLSETFSDWAGAGKPTRFYRLKEVESN